jgi:hypothetical protein
LAILVPRKPRIVPQAAFDPVNLVAHPLQLQALVRRLLPEGFYVVVIATVYFTSARCSVPPQIVLQIFAPTIE